MLWDIRYTLRKLRAQILTYRRLLLGFVRVPGLDDTWCRKYSAKALPEPILANYQLYLKDNIATS